ncbi:hypothetical protein Gotur_029007 [Gossypium turneri]
MGQNTSSFGMGMQEIKSERK